MEGDKKPTRINAELIYYQLAEIKSENAAFRAEFKEELTELKKRYVTKEESAALKAEIKELRADIAELKRSKTLLGWVYPTATAVFTALATYITIEFFRKG